MKTETKIAIEASKAGAKYDATCKELFLHKEILAPVLREVVEEYRNCTIDEIISYIDPSSIGAVPVDDVSATVRITDVNPTISGMPTEMSSMTEKLICYDSRFLALNPRLTDETIRFYLHIDMEIQNDYTPGYPITKRAVYYAAREISSQLGILTEKTDYNALQKVYSIWICNDRIPVKIQNTVSTYSFTKSDIIGATDEQESNYDLMTVVIIRRGNDDGKEDIFKYLSGLFNSDMDKISQYIDVEHNDEIKEVFHSMSGIIMDYYEKGMKDGMEQGKAEGIAVGKAEGITVGKAEGITVGKAEGKAEERKSIRQKMVLAGIPEEQIEAVFAQ